MKDFVIINFKGTSSSVELLKGYMVRETLGTPGVEISKRPNQRQTN